MININTIYQKVQQLSNKFQGSGYLPPDEFNRYVNMASLEMLTQGFNAYQLNQRVTDDIRNFITNQKLQVDEYGKLDYPSDYMFYVALRSYSKSEYEALQENCKNTLVDYASLTQIKVKLLDNDKLGTRLSSDLLKPTLQYPIAVIYADYIQLYPISIGLVQFDYLRRPQEAVWGYTQNIYGLPEYNAATSTNLDWHESVENKVIMKVCKYFGIEVREGEIYQATIQQENVN